MFSSLWRKLRKGRAVGGSGRFYGLWYKLFDVEYNWEYQMKLASVRLLRVTLGAGRHGGAGQQWWRPALWPCWRHWCFIEDLTCTKPLRCFPPSNPHNDHFQMVAERTKSFAQGYTVRGGAGIWNQDALLHPLDELKVIKIKNNGTRDYFRDRSLNV